MKKIRITAKQYKRISYLYRVGGFLTIVGLLLGYSVLIGKPTEFLLVFLPYFVTKGFYSTQYHATSLKTCFVYSVMVFAFVTTIAMPKEYSISVSIILGCGIAYGSYKIGTIQKKLKDYAYIKPRYEEMTAPRPFSCVSCTEAELIARCKELHYSEVKTGLAVEFFIKKTKHSIIADRFCIEPSSVAMSKWRMKKDLEK